MPSRFRLQTVCLTALCALALSLVGLAACGPAEQNPDNDGGKWVLPEDTGGPDVGPDTSRPDTSVPPDTRDCPEQVQSRDGTCNRACSDVDPDCHNASCPNPNDEKVNYIGDSYQNPSQCMLIDFGCPDGSTGFSKRLCGCGCIKKDDNDDCPAPSDPDYDYAAGSYDNPEVCQTIGNWMCREGWDQFNNDCGCGCRRIEDEPECPDESDPNVRYVSQEEEVCRAVKFQCEGDREPFNNECGCGCKPKDDNDGRYCSAQDADGLGNCRSLLGYKFDGARCVGVSGCRCQGADCDNLYMDRDSCRRDIAACTRGTCEPHPLAKSSGAMNDGGPGVGDDVCAPYWAWEGSTCIPVSKCLGNCRNNPKPECEGLYKDKTACERAHTKCNPGVCQPMDAKASGACAMFMGYKFDGSNCVALSGCDCKGSDCDNLMTRSECRQRAQKCGGGSGDTCSARNPCNSGFYCDYPRNGCGFNDGSGTCKSSPQGCPEFYSPVCGCDGKTYGNECIANARGVDIQSTGECMR